MLASNWASVCAANLAFGSIQDVDVRLHHERQAAVDEEPPRHSADSLLRKQECCGGVAEVMEPNLREPSALENSIESS